jgi:hypothetical protein
MLAFVKVLRLKMCTYIEKAKAEDATESEFSVLVSTILLEDLVGN